MTLFNNETSEDAPRTYLYENETLNKCNYEPQSYYDVYTEENESGESPHTAVKRGWDSRTYYPRRDSPMKSVRFKKPADSELSYEMTTYKPVGWKSQVALERMELEVANLPPNDYIRWYRSKRGFQVNFRGHAKWFSAFSRGVRNAYNMACSWLHYVQGVIRHDSENIMRTNFSFRKNLNQGLLPQKAHDSSKFAKQYCFRRPLGVSYPYDSNYAMFPRPHQQNSSDWLAGDHYVP